MKKILLTSKNNFFKGNMHCHSNFSDGKMSPEELKKYFKDRGYAFLAITDHEFTYNHAELDDQDFITITSTELSIKEFQNVSTRDYRKMKVCHLNLYAKAQDNDLTPCYNEFCDKYSRGELRAKIKARHHENYDRIYSAEGINDVIRIANENGFFVTYNHPRWSLENYAQYSKYEGLWGVEVINGSCNVMGIHEYNINVHDDLLRDGKRVFISAGDDNHSESGDDACLAYVMVNTEKKLSYSAIIDALLSGSFYTSEGPEIRELYVENGMVYIKTSDAKIISLSTEGRRSAAKRADEGVCVNEAVFELCDDDGYFRIDVLDEKGRRADSQAYFINEL